MAINPNLSTVTYTTRPMPSAKGYQDLMSFVSDYRSAGSSVQSAVHTYQDIAKATGLNLSVLDNPATIEQLWDQNKDNRVDSWEMANGLTHVDASDGEFDGVITRAGRDRVEDFFGKSVKEKFDNVVFPEVLIVKDPTGQLPDVEFDPKKILADTLQKMVDSDVDPALLAEIETEINKKNAIVDEIGINQRKALRAKNIVLSQQAYQEQLNGFYIASGLSSSAGRERLNLQA